MIARKILLAVAAAALMSTPAWALPSLTSGSQGAGHEPSSTNHPTGKGQGDGGGRGHNGEGTTGPTGPTGATGPTGPPHGHGHGRSHKCQPHSVGYVASGTLVSQTLTKNSDGTYSGEVVVEVTHTNHHARGDRGKTTTYTLKNAHVTFGLADTNKDGSVGLDDVAKGDRVHLIGRITVLAKKCSQSGFTPSTTINRLVVHSPAVRG